jgi:hypothetical protein
MRSSVFKIKFTKSAFELNDDYEYLSDIDKEKILDLEAESFFDYDEDDRYVCFVIASSIEMEKYVEVLNSNHINNEYFDLSNDILKFKINIKEELKDKISTLNSIKWSFFIDDLDEWIINHLDIDMVLDRISEVGIGTLTEVEKQFLKYYKK